MQLTILLSIALIAIHLGDKIAILNCRQILCAFNLMNNIALCVFHYTSVCCFLDLFNSQDFLQHRLFSVIEKIYKNDLIFQCYFLRKACSPEQTTFASITGW